MSGAAKKAKQESTSPVSHQAFFGPSDDKGLISQAMPVAAYDDESVAYSVINQLQAQSMKNGESHITHALYASPPVFHADSVETKDVNSMSVSSKPTTSLVSPPTSLADEMDVHDGEPLASVEGEAPAALHTPNSSSRHSSRQPRHVERFAPEVPTARPSKSASKPALTTIRGTTPGFPTSSKKPSSRPSSSYAKKSSPMAERTFDRHATTSLSPHQSKHSKHHHMTEEDTDAESLRLIRELQEEEFGLRRRRG